MAPRSKSAKKRSSAISSKAKNSKAQTHNTLATPPQLLVTPICTIAGRRGSTGMSETSEISPVSTSSDTSSSSTDSAILEPINHHHHTTVQSDNDLCQTSNKLEFYINKHVQDAPNASKEENKSSIDKATVNSPEISESLVEHSSIICSSSTQNPIISEEPTRDIMDEIRMDNQISDDQSTAGSRDREPITVNNVRNQEGASSTFLESTISALNDQSTISRKTDNEKNGSIGHGEKIQSLSLKHVESEQQMVEIIVPGMQTRDRQQNNRRDTSADVIEPEPENSCRSGLRQSASTSSLGLKGYMAKLRELEDTSEKVVRDAIQCLVKENDMELSYISILSAINVLNCRSDQESAIPVDVPEHIQSLGQSMRKEAKERTGRLYSKLLKIMTRSTIADALSKETMQQDTISPEELYLKLYNAIQEAGYKLQSQDHLDMCQFLLGSKCTEEALNCLNKIDPKRWSNQVYRASITCHLFSKPRQLHEAGLVLKKYLEYIKLPLQIFIDANKTNTNPTAEQSLREKVRENTAIVKKWFKLQLDASKWEEAVAQYERRRARLLNAPGNIERFSVTVADPELGPNNENSHSTTPQLSRRNSSVSTLSNSSSAFTIPQPEDMPKISTIPVQQTLQPSTQDSTKTSTSIPTMMSPFAFISSFMSTQRRSSSSSISTISSNNTDLKTSPTQSQFPNTLHQTNSDQSHRYQVNRYLSSLDNGMLEECIAHKQFKYGWEQIYERMGPALEDKDTVKIVMRLCKRAFLGHGGLGPNQPGSPNILAKDMCFEDDHFSDSINSDKERECDKDCDDGLEWSIIESLLIEKESVKQKNMLPVKEVMQDDPEIWEARAWVIYNKIITNPTFFGTISGSPIGSPVLSQHSSTTIGGPRNHSGGTPTSTLPSPVATSVTGNSSLTVFLHNILTIAINSPEKSSRFLKAFRIYSTMRNDPINQYQAQLRDPFVMACMIKVIYDTVLTITRSQEQSHRQREKQGSYYQGKESNMDLQAEATHKLPAMSIGPLIDLAFEIYADMRNVGPIRYLPHFSTLISSSPTISGPGIISNSNSIGATHSAPIGSSTGTMSMFFQLSSRPPVPITSTVDLSACGSNVSSKLPMAKPTFPAPVFTGGRTGSINKLDSPTSPSTLGGTLQYIFQELNPTLVQNIQARRIPSELYLALLHLCIQVPLSGIQQSFRVTKTIVTDMMTTKLGQLPANLDRHLAAALQVYHDKWMCRPRELKERRGSRDCCNSRDKAEDNSQAERISGGCMFHEWMYQPEEYILKCMASSNIVTDASKLVSDLSDTPTLKATASAISDGATGFTTPASTKLSGVTENSHYSISKRDADLDELDQYLKARAAAATGVFNMNAEKQGDCGDGWADELDQDTCNDRYYWDFWNREDMALQNIRFSRRKARMLWRHVDSLNDM